MSDVALPVPGQPKVALTGRLSSDEHLAKLVSRGHERAFSVLYQRHHQALYRYCRAIVRNEEDAKDALQNAMERALAALRHRERDLAVRPWLFRIAHNEAVSILRRRAPVAVSIDEAELAGIPTAPLDVEDFVAQREELGRLVSDLQALGERQRSALVMRELSGLSTQEIAAALATSPGAAKQLVFEARTALHEFAEGRAMDCDAVRKAISDGDRRVWRGRKMAAHLRLCDGCREFQAAISSRRTELRALAPPLPAVASSALLAKVLTHAGVSGKGAGAAAGGAAAGGGASGGTAAGTAAGNHIAGAVIAKGVAAVALAAGVTAGAVHLASAPQRHPAPRHATQRDGQAAQPTHIPPSGPIAVHAGRSGGSTPGHRRATAAPVTRGASNATQAHSRSAPAGQTSTVPLAATRGQGSRGTQHPSRPTTLPHGHPGSHGRSHSAHGRFGAPGKAHTPAVAGGGRHAHGQPPHRAPARPPSEHRAASHTSGERGGQGAAAPSRTENGRAH
jgi:RNA polymerase sigma factor (sigma-70 family)